MINNIKKGMRRRIKKIFKKSETSKCRSSLSKYCIGDGLDIGFGGDPIVPTAICLDMPEAYARYIKNPQHLHGDAKDLFWFKDETLDYIFSSHVLEDFEDTTLVLNEWLRVVKKGGNLVLFLPNELEYRKYCKLKGELPNQHHIHENFGLKYLKNIA